MMKMKIIFFVIFYSILCAMDKYESNNDILLYQNFPQEEIKIFDELNSCKKEFLLSDSILIDKDRIMNLKQTFKLSGKAFDILCNLDIINQWKQYKNADLNPYAEDHKDFVKKRKEEINLYYLGKVADTMSLEFDSHLILATYNSTDKYNIIRNVYLINSLDNKINSITRIANYTCFDGNCEYMYTEILNDGNLLLKIEKISNDVEMQRGKTDNKNLVCKFSFDNNGYVNLITFR